MKSTQYLKYALVGILGILIFASSCESPTSAGSGLPSETGSGLLIEFVGCDFPGATVAMIEFRQGTTNVAYGYGTLTNGNASFRLKDANTNEPWNATLNVAYNASAYCFDGDVGDPVPASGYWEAYVSDYIQYRVSEYAEISFVKNSFSAQ